MPVLTVSTIAIWMVALIIAIALASSQHNAGARRRDVGDRLPAPGALSLKNRNAYQCQAC